MFDRILVAVDASPAAARGLDAALDLAADQNAFLIVLHVIDEMSCKPLGCELGVADDLVEGYVDRLRDYGGKLLADVAARARRRGITYETVLVDTGGLGIGEAILAQARLLDADIVVLGTHGRRGLRRLLMGSDAETVLRNARVPVLLVRARETTVRARPTRAKETPQQKRPRRLLARALLIESSQ